MKWLVVASVVLLTAGRLDCQVGAETEVAPRFDVRRWTASDGLPQNSVGAIAQTADGFLWVGTFDGLARFDGLRFTVVPLGQGGGHARVLSLCADRGGALWVGTESSGLFRREDGRVTRVPGPDEAPWGKIWTIAEDDDGSVWVGSDRGLVRYRGAEATAFQAIEAAPGAAVYHVFLDQAGTPWIATDSGVARRTGSGFEVVHREESWQLSQDAGGGLFCCSGRAFHFLDDGRFVKASWSTPDNWITASLRDGRGRVWLGGDRGLHLVHGSFAESRALGREAVLTDVKSRTDLKGSVRALFEDRERNLWVGVDAGGLFRLTPSRFQSIVPARAGWRSSVFGVGGWTPDELWLVLSDNKLLRVRDGQLEAPPADIPIHRSLSVGVASDRAVWVSGGDRVVRWRATGTASFPWKHIMVQRHERGVSWFGGHDDIYEVRGPEIRRHVLPEPCRGVVAIAPVESGAWFVTKAELGQVVEGRVRMVPIPGDRPSAPLRSLHVDADGTVWITTHGAGLWRLSRGNLACFTTREGLHDDVLGGIIAVEETFWINSNHGVFHVRRRDLEAVATGERRRLSCQLVGSPEGNGTEALQTTDGAMWFPTLEGVVRVSPPIRFNEAVPPVMIDEVVADGEVCAGGATMEVPPGTNRLEFRFSALCYTAPEQVAFRYRLVGHDPDWVEAGSARSATYARLPAGNYQFEVRASNNDGVWNERGALVGVVVATPFHQTLWFRSACSLLLLLALFGVHRWQVARRLLRHQIGRVEEELRESRDRYRVVAETATDCIVTIDGTGRILYANPATLRVFGYSPEECVGAAATILMPEKERERFSAGIAAYLESDRRSKSWEGLQLTARRRDGSWFPVEISLGEHRHLDGSRVFTAFIRDVTERQRLQKRLAATRRMESLGRLAGGVAHDFNNIITALMGNAEFLKDSLGERSDARECVDEIERCGVRAAGLTKQLLAFSRHQVVRPTLLEADRVLSGVERMLRRLIPENIVMTFRWGAGGARIRADASQIEQLVVNLAVNARDAMPEGGRLVISTAVVDVPGSGDDDRGVPPGSYVSLEISDTGTGIDQDALPQIFEPFFTTKKVGEGTGLGLASVHGIVDRGDGHLRVRSEPGHGSTFTVFWPRAATAAPVAGPAIPAFAAAGEVRPNATILVCDDYGSTLTVARRALEAVGDRVLAASHPHGALEIATRHEGRIDALVTDVIMPDMSGSELARRIRELRPSIAVLFMTGYAAEELVESKMISGRSDVLPKPFSPEELRRRIRALLAAAKADGPVQPPKRDATRSS